MTRYDRAFELVIGHEGGFQNDRADRGNWTSGVIGKGKLRGTKFGITAMTYPNLDIRNLTREDVRPIYQRDFWAKCECDRWPDGIGYAVFDGAVNMGTGRAVRFLQQAAGAAPDGIIGPQTRRKVDAADPVKLLREMMALRMSHYVSLGTLYARFGRGWTRRAFDVTIAATAMQMGRDVDARDFGNARALLSDARGNIEKAERLLESAA